MNQQVTFIDKFIVPQKSGEEFIRQMKYNRNFIKDLAGFVKGEAYEQRDEEGNLTVITTATWKNQDYLNEAKDLVQAEFKRINFNPPAFYQRLNIKLERGIFTYIEN